MSTAMKQALKFSTSLEEHTASWWMSLEPQWLAIISLLQRKNKNEYDSTITKLLGNGAVNQWLKHSREVQYGIVFLNQHKFSGIKEVTRY